MHAAAGAARNPIAGRVSRVAGRSRAWLGATVLVLAPATSKHGDADRAPPLPPREGGGMPTRRGGLVDLLMRPTLLQQSVVKGG